MSSTGTGAGARFHGAAPAGFLVAMLWILAAWTAFPAHRDLVQPDEGRYAEIPREMVASGDWITPRLDGFVYFEKPPLQYWATAATFALFGEGNATARVVPVLLGILTVLFVFQLARRLFDAEIGAIAAVVLASCPLWAVLGHLLTLDMGLSAFLTLAIGSLAWAQSCRGDPARVGRWMLLAWAALGLAVLSKGPVALVLTGGTVLFYGFLARDLAVWKHLHLVKGLAVLLAVAVPWFVVVGIRNPGFTSFFFLHENFERYTTDVHRRVQPWWTYFPVVLLGSLPWICPIVAACLRPRSAARAESEDPRSEPAGFDPVALLWTYALFTVGFFSLSHSKLVPYVLPAFPALAILAARNLRERPRLALEAAIVLLLGAALATACAFPGLFVQDDVPPGIVASCRPFVLVAAASLLAGGTVVLAARKTGFRGVAWLGGACALALQSLLLGHQGLASLTSAREIARAIDANVPKDAPVFDVLRYDQPLPFYLGRTIEVVGYRGELDYGMLRSPEREVRDLDAFRTRWTDLSQAAAVLSTEDFAVLESSGLPMRRIFEDPGRVAVVRR